MKKLLVFTSVALIGAAAYAGVVPRVYDYSACLNTAVAKNAARVTFRDCSGQLVTINDICYRVKGNVCVKGVIVFGCNCVDEQELESLGMCTQGAYPLVLMATSIDKFTEVVLAEGDISVANRIGAPISSRALVAELGFDTHFGVGGEKCGRYFCLWHAGFGTAGVVEQGEGYDFMSVSGNAVGMARAPICSAELNNCPRCLEDGECEPSVSFQPCDMDDCEPYQGSEMGVAYGTFLVKFNKRLSDAIKPIQQEQYQLTVDTLVPLAFGRNAVAPDVEDVIVTCNTAP